MLPNPLQSQEPQVSHLKCMYTNAHSLGSKEEELALHAQYESYDVMGIIETCWEDSHDWKTTVDGYKLF